MTVKKTGKAAPAKKGGAEAKKETAVVLLSGGMDSAVAAAVAAKKYRLACLHLNYGQRTETRELECFYKLCHHYGVSERLIVDVTHLSQIGGSSLTDHHVDVPNADEYALKKGGKQRASSIPNTYVPFRNAHILAIAVSWAEVIGATRIFVGAVAEDSSGYPDTRREFYDAFEKVIKTGTKPETKIKIETPVIEMKKSEIVALGASLAVPFELTWSCYRENEKACGVCESCVLRLRGFNGAGVKDPIKYDTSIFNSETFI